MKNLKLALIAAPLIALSPFSALAQSSERIYGDGVRSMAQATTDMPDFSFVKHKPKSTPRSKKKSDYSYTKLDRLFSRGATLSRKDLSGAFIGRCYRKDNPNDPIVYMLFGGPVAASSDDTGPSFSDKTPAVFKVVLDNCSNFTSDYSTMVDFFKNLNDTEYIQNLISSRIQSKDAATLKGSFAGKWHFSKANGYILVKDKDTDHHLGYRCYFSKKIHD